MKAAITLSPRDYHAVLFDLDGVLTRTARVHAAAWKKLFDGFLEQRANNAGKPFVPFEIETDYPRYVDGKPRYDGVADFLESRGIELPLGAPKDGPDVQSVRALGNLKDRYLEDAIAGVAAGRAGGFGCVIGVDRRAQAQALRDAGADVVVTDVGQVQLAAEPSAACTSNWCQMHKASRTPSFATSKSSYRRDHAFTSAVTLGVMLGLVVGKVVGVTGFAWLAVRLGWAALPDGVAWRHITGAGLVGGVGFTVSLFITGLAFSETLLIEEAKVGVLAASLIAALSGYLFLLLVSRSSKPSKEKGSAA